MPFKDKNKSIELMRALYLPHTEERVLGIVANLGGLDVPQMNEWAENALPILTTEVISACEVMGVDGISVRTWLGLKGAGKGTNIDALTEASKEFISQTDGTKELPESLKVLLDGFSGATFTTLTGTGGMLFKPGKDYAAYVGLADKLQNVTGTGNYVEDEFTSSLVLMRMRLGLASGFTTFSHDLHPRTKIQLDHMKNLFNEMGKNGLHGELNMMYLTLMPKDALERLNSNRAGYANEAGKISDSIKVWLTIEKLSLNGLDEDLQIGKINAMLEQLVLNGDQKTQDIVGEITVSLQRSFDRKGKQDAGSKREDDGPVATLNRVRSDLGAAANFLSVDSVNIVSANQRPEEVVQDIIEKLISEEDLDSEEVRDFIRIAKLKSIEQVAIK